MRSARGARGFAALRRRRFTRSVVHRTVAPRVFCSSRTSGTRDMLDAIRDPPSLFSASPHSSCIPRRGGYEPLSVKWKGPSMKVKNERPSLCGVHERRRDAGNVTTGSRRVVRALRRPSHVCRRGFALLHLAPRGLVRFQTASSMELHLEARRRRSDDVDHHRREVRAPTAEGIARRNSRTDSKSNLDDYKSSSYVPPTGPDPAPGRQPGEQGFVCSLAEPGADHGRGCDSRANVPRAEHSRKSVCLEPVANVRELAKTLCSRVSGGAKGEPTGDGAQEVPADPPWAIAVGLVISGDTGWIRSRGRSAGDDPRRSPSP